MTCTYKFNTKDGEVKLVGQPAMKAWLAVNGIDAIIAPKGGKYGANPQLVEGQVGPRFPVKDDGAQSVTDTPAFKRWFGDSKVVGEDGRPLVVYHGTTGNFDAFDTARQGEATPGVEIAKEGIFFTDSADVAQGYIGRKKNRADELIKQIDELQDGLFDADGKEEAKIEALISKLQDELVSIKDRNTRALADGGNVMPVHLSMQNPLVKDMGGKGVSARDIRHTSQYMAAIKEAKAQGRDGVIFKNTFDSEVEAAPHTVYVAFEPEQIKSSIGNNGDFDGSNPDIRYSVKGDDRDLMITHNLTAANLMHAHKMGGIAVPSLAVVKNDSAIEGFGEITMIGSKAMADPKGYAKTQVFGADIYSPRYPSVEHDIDSKAKRAFDKQFSAMAERLGTSLPDTQDIERKGVEAIDRSLPVMAQFIKDNGIEPNIVMVASTLSEERIKRLEKFGLGPYLNKTSIYDLIDDPEFVKRAAAEAIDSYRATGNERMVKMADKLESDPEAQKNVARDIGYKIIFDSKQRLRPEADRYATQTALEKQIKDAGMADKFSQFAADTLASMSKGERIFKGFSNSGKRTYTPHTLENVVNILKKELRGGENFNYGVGSLRAKFTPQFKTVEQIKKEKGRLVSKDQFEAVKKEIDAELFAVGEAISSKANMDTIIGILEDAPKIGLERAAKQYGIELSDDAKQKAAEFLTRLKHLPTEYFEAKILRDVDLSEFSGAVIPKSTPQNVRDVLAKRGVPVREYESEADRRQVVEDFTRELDAKNYDVLFSIGEKAYSIDNGKAQAEFGPVHTEFRDDAAGAVKQLMADKNGEAIVHRDDVGDISLVYGDGKMGLSHIVNRRGAGFVDRIPELLRDGTLYSKPGQKDRVFIGTDRDEAVLRFEWDGKAKTWLLSAYEKYPDLKPAGESVQESRRSQVVDERSTAPLTKDTLRQAVTRGVLGSVVNSMIDAGVVVLHDNTSTLPRNVGNNVRGIQAVTMPDGKVHLVASNLSAKNANAVMLHEAFHQGAEKLLGNEQWGELMGRLGSLYRQGEQSSGKAKDFFDKARQRVAAAKAKGGVSAKMELEEFAAYAIEEYESAPASVKKWVDDLLGMIKAWLAKRFGKQFGDVTPAQLSAFAKWAVMDSAVQRRGDIFGDIGNLFSMAGSITDTPAFKRWFGDSKIVGENGKPLVLYHGTSGDFSEFDIDRAGKSDNGYYGTGFYFSASPETAGMYHSHTVMPVYLSIKNPYYWPEGRQPAADIHETEKITRDLIKAGHDGVIVKNHELDPDDRSNFYEVIAFTPEQIKSATGNNGDFDPSNPDIRFSVNNGVPNTGEKVTLHYLRNTESAAKNSASFGDVGQGIEPAGEYMNVDQDAPLSAPSDKWESGTITFSNPLVLEHKSTDSNGWKKDLSDMFGGKTGAALSKAVKSAGYDGIITYDKYGLSETVNLSGDKQQGAMPRFSLADDTRTTTAPAEREMQAAVPTDTKATAAMRAMQAKFQDNKNRLKQVQEAIQGQNNIDDLGLADTYRANENRPGRIAARRDDAIKYLFEPIQERLAKSGFTQDQLEELMHAQHAGERNAVVAKINPEHDPESDEFTGTQGSGMNDDKAAAILRKYSDAAELHKIADQARAISRKTLDLLLEYGYINKADHQKLAEQYEFYAPLKGDGEYGPQVKRAMGHGERDEHILENIKRDYELALVAGESNHVKQTMARMAMKYPNPELYTVGVPPMGRRVVKEGGYYVTYKDGMVLGRFKTEQEANRQSELWAATQQDNYLNYEVSKAKDGEKIQNFVKPLQDNEVIAYFNGTPVRIQFNDELLAQQMGRLSSQQLGPAMEFLKKWMRWLSAAYTGYSPTFIFTNFLRDIQTGTISMLGNQGAMIAAKAWANYPAATKALYQFATDKKSINKDSDAAKYLYEYRMNGGKTGASHMSDLEAQTKELQRMYDDSYGAIKYAKDGRVGKAAWIASRKGVGKLAHIIEAANQVTENSLRLALFMALRKEGYTPAKAAQAAKNVTVNFDRKGSATGALSAFYLFFNPAVQGTANAMKALSKGNHKGQAWAALGGMAMLGMWAASKGMDDDKDRWLGAQWDERTKNFRMRVGDKHQLNIPVSQEFAPAYAFGVAMGEVMHGESKATAATHMFASFLDAYFPLQGVFKPESDNRLADVAQAFVPTVFKPIDEAARNRNSFGTQVVPENENTKDKPDNLKMNRGTKGTVYDKAAQKIASWGEITGAGKYENDITKVSPETLKSLWRTYTGGLGTFVTDSVSLAGLGSAASDTIDSNDMPIIKRFYRELDVKDIRGRYYDLSKEAKAAITEFEQAKKVGDGAELSNIIGGEKGKLVGLGKMVRSVSKAAAALGDEKVAVNASTTLNDSEKRAELKRIEKEEEELYRSGIEAFK